MIRSILGFDLDGSIRLAHFVHPLWWPDVSLLCNSLVIESRSNSRLLRWCQFANNPIVYMTYFAFSKKYAHNLGLINASDPELFNALHQEQVDVAQRKLGTSFEDATPSPNVRVFDLDIAKFLYVYSFSRNSFPSSLRFYLDCQSATLFNSLRAAHQSHSCHSRGH